MIAQVPEALRALRRNAEATLGFWEQGVARTITVHSTSDTEVTVECQSMTTWQPTPSLVTMKRTEVEAQLRTFLDAFVACARKRCPDLARHPWFQAWADDGPVVPRTTTD